MIIDCEQYAGKCVCGKEHTIGTKLVVVEAGAIKHFEEYMARVGLADKRRVVVYDDTVYNLLKDIHRHIKADQEVVLHADGLKAKDTLIESTMAHLDRPEVIVAVGGGTIMDFGRYPAFKLGIPFVAVPTLGSSDGFTSNTCSAIMGGQKKSTPMCVPTLVVADLDIVSHAPSRLISSGINDILSKYISIADWKIAHIVDGEYYCPMIAGLAEEALHMMEDAAEKYAQTGVMDHEAMIASLVKSGLTTQLLTYSRAASGAEHLMAHLVEMHPPRFEAVDGLHGECVGVGTYACIKKYRELRDAPTPKAKPFRPLDKNWVLEKFGERLAPGIMKENAGDVLGTFDPQNIVDHWEEIEAIIDQLPTPEKIASLYKRCHCVYLPEQLGIDAGSAAEMLEISAAIRNRLTLVRMLRVLEFGAA